MRQRLKLGGGGEGRDLANRQGGKAWVARRVASRPAHARELDGVWCGVGGNARCGRARLVRLINDGLRCGRLPRLPLPQLACRCRRGVNTFPPASPGFLIFVAIAICYKHAAFF